MTDTLAIDPVQALLAQTTLPRNLFNATSRYYGIATSTLTAADGTIVVYLQRRFLPQPSRFQLVQEHAVIQGERLDNVTAAFLGAPELFWRVADANNAMRPEALVAKVGRRLRLTLPEGIVGSSL